MERAVQGIPLTGEREVDAERADRAVREALHARVLRDDLLPRPVDLPFTVSDDLDPFVPRVFPLERATPRKAQRRLAEMASSRPETRRGAAWHVAGWSARDDVDAALESGLDDPDLYARALCALGLALRHNVAEQRLLQVASDIVSEAHGSRYRWADDAVTTAALAALVVAELSREPETHAAAAEIVRRTMGIAGLHERAAELLRALEPVVRGDEEP